MFPEYEIDIANSGRAKIAKDALDFVTKTKSYSSGYTNEGWFTDETFRPLAEMITEKGITRIILRDLADFPGDLLIFPGIVGLDANDPSGQTAVIGLNFDRMWPRVVGIGTNGADRFYLSLEEVLFHEMVEIGLGNLNLDKSLSAGARLALERRTVEYVNESFRDELDIDSRDFSAYNTIHTKKGYRVLSKVTPECFASGTLVSMADGSFKAIEEVKPGDEVLSYDDDGALKAGKVTRTFRNEVNCLLDLHGLMVTPGHATFCADGRFAGQHVPVIDILRSDRAMMRADGTKVRAATGAELGSSDDRMVHCVLTRTARAGDGLVAVGTHYMRYGTRVILEDGRDVSIREIVEGTGSSLTDDGNVQTEDGRSGPFNWSAVQPMFPKPEDYILARSGLTLEEIYEADEWESVGPQISAPAKEPRLSGPSTVGSGIGLLLKGSPGGT